MKVDIKTLQVYTYLFDDIKYIYLHKYLVWNLKSFVVSNVLKFKDKYKVIFTHYTGKTLITV